MAILSYGEAAFRPGAEPTCCVQRLSYSASCGSVSYQTVSLMFDIPSKWTAFLLSACVPGAGQLAARSWTCLAWFAAAGALVVGWSQVEQLDAGHWILPLQMGAGLTLCLLSAEHAKRLLEDRHVGKCSAVVASSPIRCRRDGRKLELELSLDMARSSAEAWALIRDLPRFLTIDPFHDKVTLMRDQPALGVDLVLSHNAFGRRFLRFGRIIAWREGSGYTFSDLSPRGPKVGFPHVFMINLRPMPSQVEPTPFTRLTLSVRGRWTSSLVPVCLGRLWVWLVFREHVRLLRKGI